MIAPVGRTATIALTFALGAALGWFGHAYLAGRHAGVQTAMPPHVDPSRFPGAGSARPVEAPDGPTAALNLLTRLLADGRYTRAVEFRDALSADASDELLAQTRQRILRHAAALTDQRNYAEAIELLSAYLQREFRDVDAHRALADALRRNGRYRAAIDALYDARGYAIDSKIIARINAGIRSVVAEYAATLAREKDPAALAELYSYLVQLEPQHSPYFLGLAEAQMALDDLDGARQSLGLITHDAAVGQQATRMLEQIGTRDTRERPTTTTIPITRLGSQFIVEAAIDRHATMRLLLDTGATLTIIKPSALAAGGVQYVDSGITGWFNTAGGRIEAPLFTLETLSLAEQSVNDLQIAAIELSDSPHIDGLLGMNYLRHYRFFIDQSAGVLRLSRND